VAVAALVVSLVALAFTVLVYWWGNSRRGTLQAGRPGAYALAGRNVRLRLPLALYNTGATALIVTDLRVVATAKVPPPPYLWVANLDRLQPKGKEHEHRDLATPFAVSARSTRELVIEFAGTWCPVPGTERWTRLEAKVHPSGD
jgi:hypothetical protein